MNATKGQTAVAKKKRLTLADVRRVAAKYGAVVDEQHSGPGGREFSVIVDLYGGRTWKANGGCHGVYSSTYDGGADDRSDCCRDAIEQMEHGTNDPEDDGTCGDPECEWCHPEG